MSLKFGGNVQLRADLYYKEAETKNGTPFIIIKATSSKATSAKSQEYVISFSGVLEFWGKQCQKFKEMELKNLEYITVLSGIVETSFNPIIKASSYHFVVFEFERKSKSKNPPPNIIDDAPPEPVLPGGFPF